MAVACQGGDEDGTGVGDVTGGAGFASAGDTSTGGATGGRVASGGSLGSGGASTAGQATSGGNSPGTGGAALTGGVPNAGGQPTSGGTAAGGVAPGGASSGGSATGGLATGGADAMGGILAGGTANGGAPVAGTANGGEAAGGGANGGAPIAGAANGGAPIAGAANGGDAAGGEANGGAAGAELGGSGGCSGAGCETPTVIAYPDVPGAERSSLYTVTVDGTPLFVEKLSKYAPEMQVHYAHCSLSSPATVEVTVNESFNSFKLSPTSRGLDATKNGSTIAFQTGPNYLILQVDSKELLFLLFDPPEENPPQLGDANVKNIADYDVDNTGATLETTKIQQAIDAASGAAQNILYFPPGRYQIGELWLKSEMTLYLAGGALLYGSNRTGDFNTGNGGINIEGCSHGVIRMFQIHDAKILGRGIIDGNGKSIRAQNDTKINLLKIEQSSNLEIDGILVRDSSFWNTLIYRSDAVTIRNYKMINCRPNADWNNTDGVDFDESTDGVLSNAFLYTGDDSMATKNEEPSGTVNTSNILHEHVVAYSNSVGCKVGTKTMGQSMDDVVFRDIDVVNAGRALTIEGYDTATVRNTTFEDVRVEQSGVFIKLALDEPPDWRDAANQSTYIDTYFTNVSSDSNRTIQLHGRSGTSGTIDGVHFSNVTIQGNAITSQTDPDASWNIANGVTDITFE